MAKNERTSRSVGSLASKVLKGTKTPTKKEVLSLAAAALTQRPDRR